jgi:hypothetical protein
MSAELREELTLVAERLERDALAAEDYAKRLQTRRDKYNENPSGEKPAAVGCLPLVIAAMNREVRQIRDIIERLQG